MNIDSETRIHTHAIKPSNMDSICKLPQIRAYCKQGFYGPIFSEDTITSDLFYFGGFQKALLKAVDDFEFEYDTNSILEKGYIYGLVEVDLHPLEEVSEAEQEEEFTNAGLCF